MRKLFASALAAGAVLAAVAAGCSSSGSSSGSLVGVISISPSTLPGGTVGTTYTQTFTASGGTSPYGAWAVTVGALPAGLTLNPVSGVLTGIPGSVTTSSFIIFVQDARGKTGTRGYTLHVSAATGGTVTLTPGSGALTDAIAGAPFAVSVTASGGTAPYTFSVSSGTLPTGVSLDAASGVLGGTPTTAVTAQAFTISATDVSLSSGSADYTLNVILKSGKLFVSDLADTLGASTNFSSDVDPAGLAVWRFDVASTVTGTAVAPDATIAGPDTQLSAPDSFTGAATIAYDVEHDLLWFGAQDLSSAAGLYGFPGAHAAGSTVTALENVTPSAVFQITTTASTLQEPVSIAIDSVRNLLYTVDDDTSSLYRFSLDQVAGGITTPSAAISSFSTPQGVFVDGPNDRLYVIDANSLASFQVGIYDHASAITNGAVPARTLKGGALSGGFLTQIFVDPARDVMYVSSYSPPSIYVFDHASTVTSSSAAPDRTISSTTVPSWADYGGSGNQSALIGMTVDIARDELYVTDPLNAQVLVFANASSLDDAAGASPIRGIQSPAFTANSSDPPSVLLFDPTH